MVKIFFLHISDCVTLRRLPLALCLSIFLPLIVSGPVQMLCVPGALAQTDEIAGQINRTFRLFKSTSAPTTPQKDPAFGAFQKGQFLTAFALALPRAKHNDPAAQTLIAEIYAKGLGIAQNSEEAAKWYTMAKNAGDPNATFLLAELYQKGHGVTKDRRMAANLFKLAAKRGHATARYNVALLHMEGIYAKPSQTEAARLMIQAAEQNIARAQYDLGVMYLEGIGVPPSSSNGAQWILKAARNGNVEAKIHFARLAFTGTGTQKNTQQATAWIKQAAWAENPVAQMLYARLLWLSEDIERNIADAAMWYLLAVQRGAKDTNLQRLFDDLNENARALAQERARFWPSEPLRSNIAQASAISTNPF